VADELEGRFVTLAAHITNVLEKAVWVEGEVPEDREWDTLKSIKMMPGEAYGVDMEMPHARLRLDWELSQDALDENVHGNDLEGTIRNLMKHQMASDFADLVLNGDRKSNDPLLQSLDGELKLGKRMVEFKHGQMWWYRELKGKKNTWEYTVYTIIQPIFK
jgi:hypothetical protein